MRAIRTSRISDYLTSRGSSASWSKVTSLDIRVDGRLDDEQTCSRIQLVQWRRDHESHPRLFSRMYSTSRAVPRRPWKRALWFANALCAGLIVIHLRLIRYYDCHASRQRCVTTNTIIISSNKLVIVYRRAITVTILHSFSIVFHDKVEELL